MGIGSWAKVNGSSQEQESGWLDQPVDARKSKDLQEFPD